MAEFISILLTFSIVLLAMASLLTVAGLIRFSPILFKLITLEVLTNILMSSIAIWSLLTKQAVFIDVCLTLALIMFLSIVAYYQFLSLELKNDD